MLSRVIRKDRDEPFVYNSGGSSLLRAQSGAALLVITLGAPVLAKKSLTLGRLYHQKSVYRFSRRAMVVLQRPWALGRLIMLRHNVPVRRDLDQIAADNGFDFHIIDNEIYGMRVGLTVLLCARLKSRSKNRLRNCIRCALRWWIAPVKDEEILTQLAIPPLYWDVIAESWRARDPSLYGRMDLPGVAMRR
ncbi:glutathionylspermidine synthase YjfC [Escherichia coli]|uniref:Glutathionylspermidine synthase YjfC n=1 Tax=Escherichia coli TaxID=562 RepID=A0A377APT9_ECOLX|nr:glutathionylspermidine synthase YjfC [Escherichia coli]